MSKKDMLGQIVRSLVGVDSKHHGLVLDIANKLGGDSAVAVHTNLAKALREPIESENLRTVKFSAVVHQNRDWTEALEAAGPNTLTGTTVRQVGDLYPSVSDQVETVDFVALNFPKGGGSWDKALAWAKSNVLKPTNPREVFAPAEKPDLRKVLGVSSDWFYLVATTACSFGGDRRAVCICVVRAYRDANLGWLEDYGDRNGWFLFRK